MKAIIDEAKIHYKPFSNRANACNALKNKMNNVLKILSSIENINNLSDEDYIKLLGEIYFFEFEYNDIINIILQKNNNEDNLKETIKNEKLQKCKIKELLDSNKDPLFSFEYLTYLDILSSKYFKEIVTLLRKEFTESKILEDLSQSINSYLEKIHKLTESENEEEYKIDAFTITKPKSLKPNRYKKMHYKH